MRKYLNSENTKHGEVRQLKRENLQLWDSADNYGVSWKSHKLHATTKRLTDFLPF